jgi:hypothetical protein
LAIVQQREEVATMSVRFPSLEFFEALKKRLEEDAGSMADVEPSEAYCGLAIGDRLFVLEFEGHQCVAAVHGGNPIDLDFVIAGSIGIWQEAVQSVAMGETRNTLTELVEKGRLEIQSEDPDGNELARGALPFLEAFLGQAKGFDLDFE